MNFIHENKVNKLSEWNLIHDILNTSKRTKIYIQHLLSYFTFIYEYP